MYDFIYNARAYYGKTWSDNFAMYLFLFYDARGAVEAAYEPDFWEYVRKVYPTCKRGTERRHFRGAKGLAAIEKLSHMGSPTVIWLQMHRDTYQELYQNISVCFNGCEIGPYFAWKAMDILDRGIDRFVNISLVEALKYLPDSPRKCAKAVYPEYKLEDVLMDIVEWIEDLVAPGNPNRYCGIPEAETIMCAIHGLQKGSYRFGEDIDRRQVQLAGLPELRFLPKSQDWILYEGY